jgi:hypothetical protein
MRKLLIFSANCFLVTALCGCEPIKLNAQQVMNIEDFKLCELSEKFLATETQLMVDNEISKRKIDCHPHHQQCVSFGLTKGTKEYATCRLELHSRQTELEKVDKIMEGMRQVESTPKKYEVHSY